MDQPTPTGVLVQPADQIEPLSPGWYAARRLGITATDLPKILGLSKYGNALSVYNDKTRAAEWADDSEREEAYWGRVMEGPVADRWAEQNGGVGVRPVGTLANRNEPWMLASLDRLVPICPDGKTSCGLEVKTRSAYVAGKWKEDVPDDVLAQVQWQLMVSGLPHAHVACLLGGQRLASFTVDRDARLEVYLLKAARPVWECVQKGTPPPVEADAGGVLLAELNRMFADRAGSVRVDMTKAVPLMRAYGEGHHREGEGASIKAVAKTEMIQLMGGAEVAVGNDELRPLWTYKAGKTSDEMTAGNVRRLKTECPEVYRDLVALGYITKTKPSRKFLPKF